MELLPEIAEHAPESMLEAAQLVDRDVPDIHSDLKQLAVLGILELDPGAPGGAMQPVVPFDRIGMDIDDPLVDGANIDGDRVPAGA